MSIEAAIEARAAAFAGLTALIGTTPTRFYPEQAEQGAILPYVTYSVITDPPVHVMGADKEAQAHVQFDAWASSWVIARAVRDQLKLCFDRLAGTFGGTTVIGSVCDNRGMTVQPEDTSLLPRITMEFTMTHLTP
jgi:hypothetical protein